ncbi:MAG: hypothetical protein ABEJ61_04925 [Haloferacaceae archaeon]
MRTVEDEDGNRYLLVKRAGESSLVRDPATGEERSLAADELATVADVSPLATVARTLDDPVRRLVLAAHDDRALGLLLELDARGPLAVRTLLDGYDLCESDLHGLLAEFRAAGLVAERTVDGRRGYGLTDDARAALTRLE